MYDVAIIGAGLSGLYAGRLLNQAGKNFVIFEARDRPGGRVWSQACENSDASVDLGAQWIGPGQNRMYKLADEFNLKRSKTYYSGSNILQTKDGVRSFKGPVPPLGFWATLDLMQLGLRFSISSYFVNGTSKRRLKQNNKLKSISAQDWINQKAKSQGAREFWLYLLAAGTCAAPDSFSMYEIFKQMKSIGGLAKLESAEHEYFPGGVQAIAHNLAELVSDSINYNTNIQSLKEEANASITLTAKDGKTYTAKKVILALPPQLYPELQLITQQTQPATPEVVTGIVTKNILIYERPWWRQQGFSGLVYSLSSPIGVTLDTSPSPDGPGVLVAIASGPKATEFGKQDENKRQQFVTEHIEATLGKAPVLLEFHTKDWTSDPNSLGGYAARQRIGSVQQNQLNSGSIFFAGTEMATEWRSYMEGALAAGEKAAQGAVAAL